MNFIGNNILQLFYLISSIICIAGLRMLTNDKNANKGNTAIAVGMLTAVVATLLFYKSDDISLSNYHLIIPAIVMGAVLGWLYAAKNKKIDLSKQFAVINGLGGFVIVLIGVVEFPNIDSYYVKSYGMANSYVLPVILGIVAAGISFSGSLFALIKLDSQKEVKRMPFVRFINFALVFLIVGLSIYIFTLGNNKMTDEILHLYFTLLFFSFCYGLTLLVPAKKTDVPLIVAFLNMFTGIGLAMLGFFYSNLILLEGGILAASISIVLTLKLCAAADRKFINLLLGDLSGKQKEVTK